MAQIDFSNYQSWPQYVSPNGQVYYVVPGQEDWMYDPVMSANDGRPHLFQNPEAAIREKEDKEKEIKDAKSPLNQIMPVAAGIAGTAGGVYAVNAVTPDKAVGLVNNGTQIMYQSGALKDVATGAMIQPGASTATTATATTAPAAQTAFLGGASEAFPVATDAATGGTIMSDGAVVAPEAGFLSAATPYLGAAGAGLGAYGVYNATQMKDKKKAGLSGFLSGAGMGAGLGMAAPLVGLGPVGWGTLGLMALGGAALGGGAGFGLAHKSTKDIQAERWGALDPASQGLYAANHPENDDGVWDTGKYAGQKWTFDKAKDLAGEDPTHFIGVLGNLETYGPEWLNLSLDQQKAVVAKNVADDLYVGDKGDVIIFSENQDRARQNMQAVLNGDVSPAKEGPLKLPDNAVKNETPVESGGQIVQPKTAQEAFLKPLDLPELNSFQVRPLQGNFSDTFGSGPVPQIRPEPPWQVEQNPAWSAFIGSAAPNTWDQKIASGEWRKGSKAAGGYVNNKTGEWVAG